MIITYSSRVEAISLLGSLLAIAMTKTHSTQTPTEQTPTEQVKSLSLFIHFVDNGNRAGFSREIPCNAF